MTPLRLGSYQGPIATGDFRRNLETVLARIEEGVEAGLDFLCFPETFLSGYSAEAVRACAVEATDAGIQEIVAATAGNDLVVLVGFPERVETEIRNAVLVAWRGDLLGLAYKVMLTRGFEAEVFAPMLEFPVFEAHGVTFGVTVCHATSFVEPSLILRLRGARLLFTPHYNDIAPATPQPDGGTVTSEAHRTMVLNNQAALATLLKMVVVRSNAIRIREDALGWGDSNIWDMDGRLVAAGRPFVEEIVSAEFARDIFEHDHFISRREVPLELYRRIALEGEAFLHENRI